MDDTLKKLGALIEIATNGGHAVSVSTAVLSGNAGPNVSFGVDGGGAFVAVNGGPRMTLDDAVTLVADLTNGICAARRMEWSRERGLTKSE